MAIDTLFSFCLPVSGQYSVYPGCDIGFCPVQGSCKQTKAALCFNPVSKAAIVIVDAFLQLCYIINIPDLSVAALGVKLPFNSSYLALFLMFLRFQGRYQLPAFLVLLLVYAFCFLLVFFRLVSFFLLLLQLLSFLGSYQKQRNEDLCSLYTLQVGVYTPFRLVQSSPLQGIYARLPRGFRRIYSIQEF